MSTLSRHMLLRWVVLAAEGILPVSCLSVCLLPLFCVSVTFMSLLKPIDGFGCHLNTKCCVRWVFCLPVEGGFGAKLDAIAWTACNYCKLLLPPGKYKRATIPPFAKWLWLLSVVRAVPSGSAMKSSSKARYGRDPAEMVPRREHPKSMTVSVIVLIAVFALIIGFIVAVSLFVGRPQSPTQPPPVTKG